ncbi:hypothetical protein DSC45_10855 [Streptomyces sp. YIM 130001]|uniref:hypothetical protein n=1 Tax=Streptomyces sp. YIM 130001 TaxID=2259644 RepID=UPI000E658F3E|nr:hypothetical protein [Streptomyces sp. YIM 130001]RII18408.1 hypothetical protein DSC45_10855 [Streptomyces sp. YIM 130001]
MNTAWTWAHYSHENPDSEPLCTGETYLSETAARQALARYLAALEPEDAEELLQELRAEPAGRNIVLPGLDGVFTTRYAGAPYGTTHPTPLPGQPHARTPAKPSPALRVEQFLIYACVVVAFFTTGTGFRALVQPEGNVASPILLVPGIALFTAAYYWTANWRRRAGRVLR